MSTWHIVRRQIGRSRIRFAGVAALLLASAPAGAAEFQAVATIKPLHALVAQVMEGVGTPRLLVAGQASLHSFALKPSDAEALAHADIFFRISEDIEPFTRRVVDGLPRSARTVTLAEADGISLIDRRGGGSPGGVVGALSEEEHDPHEADAHAHDAPRDLHIWLDPHNAKAMVRAIAAALADVAPEHRDQFEANAVAALARLDRLAAEIEREVAGARGKPFAVVHDAYRYFSRRFGLEPGVPITLSPELAPSAKRLAAVRATLTSAKASCVFTEPNTNPAVIAAVREGTAAKTGVLDPDGLAVAEGPGAYDAMLLALATGFRGCLAGD